jgi:hypothetical protein
MGTDVSEEPSAAVFMIKCRGENAAGYFYALKTEAADYCESLVIIYQTTAVVILISTAARTSNLASLCVCVTLYE